MGKRVIYYILVILLCTVRTQASLDYVMCENPNGYIDDPNILENALFEYGDPNLTNYDIIPPTYWERIPFPESTIEDGNDLEAFASIFYRPNDPNKHSFDPKLENGDPANWYIANPYEGNSFVLLKTDLWPNTNEYPKPHIDNLKSSTIRQKVFLGEGDTILGAYFFGTVDYRHFLDAGSIWLEPVDPNSDPNQPISLVYIDIEVSDVNDFESTLELSPETGGWLTFSHTIEPNQVGMYYFNCSVEDDIDLVYDSYFAVDGLRICRQGIPAADFDWDCDVDLVDFSFISEAWLAFCPDDPNVLDPNIIDPNLLNRLVTDPNIPCQLTDIDNNWFVDSNDLAIFSEDWLKDNKDE